MKGNDSPLNKKQYGLLITLVNSPKCFDRKDNTFLLSNRKLADIVSVSASSIDQLFRILKKHNLIKTLHTVHMESDKPSKAYRMLSPRFLWISYIKTDRYYYSALYELESVEKADTWRKVCRNLGGLVDVHTGEIDDSFTWHFIDSIAERYTCWDKCYRRDDTQVTVDEDQHSPQGYNLRDADLDGLTLYDRQWFEMVNSESEYNYPDKLKFNHKKRVNSMYSVGLKDI